MGRLFEIPHRKDKPTLPQKAVQEQLHSGEMQENQIKTILHLSFKYSQQEIELQRNYHRLIHTFHPDLRMHAPLDSDLYNRLVNHVATMADHLRKGGMHNSFLRDTGKKDITEAEQRSGALAEAETQVLRMHFAFKEQPRDRQLLIQDSFNRLIRIDSGYLTREGGRVRHHPKGDSWSSDFIKYIKAKEMPDTGHPYFNEIFENLRAYYKSGDWKKDTTAYIDQVTGNTATLSERIRIIEKVYRQHHPSPLMQILHRVGVRKHGGKERSLGNENK